MDAMLIAPLTEAVAPDTFSLKTTVEATDDRLVVVSYHTASWLCLGGIHVQASPFSAALIATAHADGRGHVKTLVSLAEEESVRIGMAASAQSDGGTIPTSMFMLSTLQNRRARDDRLASAKVSLRHKQRLAGRTAPAVRSTIPGY